MNENLEEDIKRYEAFKARHKWYRFIINPFGFMFTFTFIWVFTTFTHHCLVNISSRIVSNTVISTMPKALEPSTKFMRECLEETISEATFIKLNWFDNRSSLILECVDDTAKYSKSKGLTKDQNSSLSQILSVSSGGYASSSIIHNMKLFYLFQFGDPEKLYEESARARLEMRKERAERIEEIQRQNKGVPNALNMDEEEFRKQFEKFKEQKK